MFKYNCLNNISETGLQGFDGTYVQCASPDDADCLLVRSASMHEMELADNLQAIARAGAGVNNIPLDRCTKSGIVVFNTPGANANAVKELVIAGMLYASRGIVEGIEWLESQSENENVAKDTEKQKKQYAGTEIGGKKLGIIGLGAIGVKVANAAVNLGMEVYGYDPYISVDAAWHLSRAIKHVLDVEEIYRNCDFISIHVPLMDSTRHMINSAAIEQMKDNAVLLNFARDALVDEEAVIEALSAGRLKKYISDFPNPTTVGAKGCIITPHLGASTEESEENCAIMAVKELRNYMENGNIQNSVNYPSLNMGICSSVGRVLIFHANKAGIISKISTTFAEANVNISSMDSKSRGEYAVAMLDIDSPITDEVVRRTKEIEGVVRVRVVK